MNALKAPILVLAGVGIGLLAMAVFNPGEAKSLSAGNDRHGDYIICTGPVSMVNSRVPSMDGVWLLDYRSGKLLSTLVDRASGQVNGWSEVDLVSEFGIPPKTDVHFMMTTGMVNNNQAALYIAEVSTGKFGVYTMGVNGSNPTDSLLVKRHSLVSFRAASPPKP